MKTALLVCDHVPDDLRIKHGDYPHMYQQLFPDLILDPFYVCDRHFPDLASFDLFMITGSRYSVYDDIPWIKLLQEFIRKIFEAGKKCIGICFGHQIIAEALGGKVTKAEVGYLIGVHTFDLFDQPAWSSENRDQYNVLMLCQDQVVQLPPGASVLAGNKDCPVGMYYIGDQFFAIQGHPEFSKAYDQDVFMSRRHRMGEANIEQALKSFYLEPDQEWLQLVMMDFIS